jgi:type II secretory pathway component PulF
LRWWPVSRASQVLFAEAMGQAVAAGLDIGEAIDLAAKVNPSLPLRRALREMQANACSGYSLATSLELTGVWVGAGLFAALEIGEEQGCLAEELFAFARRLHPDPPAALQRATGRRPEATRFAAALARLLGERSLTLDVVEAAGRVAAAGNRAFLGAVGQVMKDMENGGTLAEALRRHPGYFDPLYCRLVEAAQTREQVRLNLERLGRPERAA